MFNKSIWTPVFTSMYLQNSFLIHCNFCAKWWCQNTFVKIFWSLHSRESLNERPHNHSVSLTMFIVQYWQNTCTCIGCPSTFVEHCKIYYSNCFVFLMPPGWRGYLHKLEKHTKKLAIQIAKLHNL